MGDRWQPYARQSKGNRVSIGQQLEVLQREAEAHSAEVLTPLTDSVSASKFAKVERKQWPDVLPMIENRSIDVLALWEVSRGERRATPWSQLLDLCAKVGVKIWVSTHGRLYDAANDADWEALQREGIAAEMESRKTSKRTLRNAAHSAAEGLPVGKNLYGYRRIRADDRTLLGVEIVPDQANVVKEAAKRFAKGESLRSIAADFAERGVVGLWGKPMPPLQIRRMISNKSYLGIRTHNGTECKGQWEAILDPEIFDLCATRLADPARTTRLDGATKHLLTGIALCDVCDAPLKLVPKHVMYLACSAPAAHVAIQQAQLDEYVADKVQQRMFKLREEPRHDAKAQALKEAAQAEVKDIEREIAELTEQVKARRISALVAGPVSLDLEERLDDAKRRATQVTPSRMVRFISNDGKTWFDRTIEERRDLVRRLVVVRVRPAGKHVGRYGAPPVEDRVSVEDQPLEEFTP